MTFYKTFCAIFFRKGRLGRNRISGFRELAEITFWGKLKRTKNRRRDCVLHAKRRSLLRPRDRAILDVFWADSLLRFAINFPEAKNLRCFGRSLLWTIKTTFFPNLTRTSNSTMFISAKVDIKTEQTKKNMEKKPPPDSKNPCKILAPTS